MLRNEFYRMLKTVIDADQFVEDDIKSLVRIKLPLKIEDVKDLKLWVLGIFGNFHVPCIDPQLNPKRAGYKIDSHFIDYDKKTIDVNEHGKLVARAEMIADELINDPNKWQTFLEGLFAVMMNDPQALNYFTQMIAGTSFVDDIKNQVVTDLLNDPTLESKLLTLASTPFDISQLVGRWQQPGITNIELNITSSYNWTLTGPTPSNWAHYTGTKCESLDNKDFVLIKANTTYPTADVALITGRFYGNKIMISLTDSATPGAAPTRNLVMEKLP